MICDCLLPKRCHHFHVGNITGLSCAIVLSPNGTVLFSLCFWEGSSLMHSVSNKVVFPEQFFTFPLVTPTKLRMSVLIYNCPSTPVSFLCNHFLPNWLSSTTMSGFHQLPPSWNIWILIWVKTGTWGREEWERAGKDQTDYVCCYAKSPHVASIGPRVTAGGLRAKEMAGWPEGGKWSETMNMIYKEDKQTEIWWSYCVDLYILKNQQGSFCRVASPTIVNDNLPVLIIDDILFLCLAATLLQKRGHARKGLTTTGLDCHVFVTTQFRCFSVTLASLMGVNH